MESKIVQLLNEIKSLMEKDTTKYWLNMKDATRYTSLSESTIRRAIKRGDLMCSRRLGKLLFQESDIRRWLNG